MFLVLDLVVILVFGFFEIRHRTSVIPALGRVFGFLLQGTWFFQVGFLLYPPSGKEWDEFSHDSMMISTMIFTIHLAFVFLFMIVFAIFIHLRVQKMDKITMDDWIFPYSTLTESIDQVFDLKLGDHFSDSEI